HTTTHDLHLSPTRRSSDLSAFSRTTVRILRPNSSEVLTLSAAAAAAAYWVLTSSVVVVIRSWSFGWLPKKKVSRLPRSFDTQYRSEEHTSELQSRGHLVCR